MSAAQLVERVDIDRLYRSFCDELAPGVRAVAENLAFHLRLTPIAHVPWSGVFKNELTLHAPLFFCGAMPGVDSKLRTAAVLAHMLAIIEAFGSDRIADGQTSENPALLEVLRSMRTARNVALYALGASAAVQRADAADETTRQAIAQERRIFDAGVCVGLATYQLVSARKQAVAVPASVALGAAAGLSESALGSIEQTLTGICLGLQCQDDVADWEDDAARGGAWALLLAGETGQSVDGVDRHRLSSSGVLARLLALSAEAYADARSGAQALGLTTLETWLQERAAEARELSRGEARQPGYMERRQSLAGLLQVL